MPLYLIGSTSFLQVTRTTIISGIGSKFSQTRAWAVELAAHERLEKIPIDLLWEICCDHSSAFNFKLIFFILADKDNYKSLNEFEFRQGPITFYGICCS